MSTIYAVHFLLRDMRSQYGNEEPWRVGETRRVKGALWLCNYGYHYAPTWRDALLGRYLYGEMACIVEVNDSGPKDAHKGVSRSRKLVEAYDVTRALRLFAADEAELALKAWEDRTGKNADPRSWAAIDAARKHAAGKVTDEQLAAAYTTAYAAYSAYDTAAGAAAFAIAVPTAAAAAARAPVAADAAVFAGERFAAAMHEATGWADV